MDTSDLLRGDGPLKRTLRLFAAAAQSWVEGRAIRLGAAVAYYALFALIPVLLLAVGLASIFIDESVVTSELESGITDLIGADAAAVVIDTILTYLDAEVDPLVSLIGLGVLLFSATLLFVAWKDVVDIMWDSPRIWGARGTIRRRLFGVLAVVGSGVLLTASLMADAVIAYVGRFVDSALLDALISTTSQVVPLALGAVFIGVLYKFTPEPEVAWQSVWLASVVSMLMLWLGAAVYGIYLENYGFQSVSGVAGTVVLGLVLVYYAAMILLYGMEIVKLLHDDAVPESISLRSGSRG